MTDEKKNEQEAREAGLARVTPVEAPSENYLVVEHLQRMPSIFARGLVYITILLVLVGLLYSYLAKIDVVISCQAVARPASHKIRVLSDRDGYLAQVRVSEGQQVEKGVPLFVIRSKETLTYVSTAEQLRLTIPLREEHYDTKISLARDQLKQRENQHSNALKVMGLKLEQNALSQGSIESDLAYWGKEVERLSQEVERTKRLLDKGVATVTEHDRLKSELERARTEVQKFDSQRNIALREKSIIQEEIGQETASYENQRVIVEKEIKNLELEKKTSLQSLEAELEVTEKMLSLKDGARTVEPEGEEKGNIIRAEKAGTISELYFRNPGEYVRESDLLCTMVPADSPLYMDITVLNKDVGFIEKEMEIKYKFDAFRYTDYGTLSGKVSAVSPSAVEDRALGWVYHVRGTLEQGHFEIDGVHHPVMAGMTATAELVTEKKSILSILFRKIKG
jgi:multidrug efflux pump subunit AcrA (membrane-fusion protein)